MMPCSLIFKLGISADLTFPFASPLKLVLRRFSRRHLDILSFSKESFLCLSCWKKLLEARKEEKMVINRGLTQFCLSVIVVVAIVVPPVLSESSTGTENFNLACWNTCEENWSECWSKCWSDIRHLRSESMSITSGQIPETDVSAYSLPLSLFSGCILIGLTLGYRHIVNRKSQIQENDASYVRF
mmetsp:Transcript_45145/g.51861  ORF Transcript_45145/g.51861 Transcript_45145/m.51861 type:complete len:185 (+) Transcript_45145:750-1304(+)